MITKIKNTTPNQVAIEFTAEGAQTCVCLTKDEFIDFINKLNRLYFESYA